MPNSGSVFHCSTCVKSFHVGEIFARHLEVPDSISAQVSLTLGFKSANIQSRG